MASEDGPRTAVILAAGRGERLAPYTDGAPTALISIAGRPMVAHTIEALRRQGVQRFFVCRGWQGAAFDAQLAGLGNDVELVDCPEFSSTGMLESLRLATERLDASGGFYLAYGDIVFRPNIARQLREASAPLAAVVHAGVPGVQSKGFAEVEAVTTSGIGVSRAIRRVGKERHVRPDEIAGEFGGLLKVSASGRAAVNEAFRRLWPENGSCTGGAGGEGLPWWLEPVATASVCDLLQLLVDDGVVVAPVMIFGGWHEVNSPQDLTRAQNDTPMFLSEDDARLQVAAMGACLLSEANDLKRTLPIVAKELNIDLSKLECLLRGDLDVNDALDVLKRMSEVYPVPLNDLWLDADDTDAGVRLFTAEAAEATSRVLDRPSASGVRTPYYEYRDAAMSRCSQFRPEWIKELRIVPSSDPSHPDVQLNNGHLMMQTTLFIGPVDFYYTDRHGVVRRESMQTGDSNFISPFVPHSFTARETGTEAIIIAVTFGGHVRRAFTEFSRVGAKQVFALAGDLRDPALVRRCTMRRLMEAECMSATDLAAACAPRLADARVSELIGGEAPEYHELEVLADALHVRISDLWVTPLAESEEVVVTRSGDSRAAGRETGTYRLAPLARTKHQPDLKTFDLEVLGSARPGDELRCGLHTFVYHFGSEPVELAWEDRGRSRASLLRPGDSAYVAPMTTHRFSAVSCDSDGGARPNPNGAGRGEGRRLFLVRIPGHLYGETLAEFATFSGLGRERVGAETVRWYN